jgi:uroporphyrinogen decarboxylase
MTRRDNFLSLLRRKGYDKVPVEFMLCPSLIEEYKRQTGSDISFKQYFGMPWKEIGDRKLVNHNTEMYRKFYDFQLKPGTDIDIWGVAREPGSSAEAYHLTHLRNPLKNVENIECIMEYPLPDFRNAEYEHQIREVEEAHAKDLAAVGMMQCTIWETSWYIRGMEELMMDMMCEDPKAEYLLERVTNLSIIRAESFARAGADIIFLGDDIGMQRTTMMSEKLYCTYLKPRLKRVIQAAKAVKPDIIIFYHSCGFITPLIPHLIDAGIDVLNPVQPECMNFAEIHEKFGDRLSFHGTIGTQTTMPFASPEEIRREVFKNLDIAGDKGGLFVAPTHVLEPEVPWENITAYVKACKDYK